MTQIVSVLTAMTALLMVQTPTDTNVYTLSNGTQCPAQGNDSNPSIIALDLQKNRPTGPAASDIDRDVSLAAMLAPGDDTNRFDATRGASVAGIVIRVKTGSVESCNCDAKDAVDQDTHIELALAAGATVIQRVVVEVTPRLRKQMKAMGKDWSTATLSARTGPAASWASGCESRGGSSLTRCTSASPRIPILVARTTSGPLAGRSIRSRQSTFWTALRPTLTNWLPGSSHNFRRLTPGP